MNDNIHIPSYQYDENLQPFTTVTYTNKQTKKAVNLRDRYELLLDKINNEIQQQNLKKSQSDYDSIVNSEENASHVFSSDSQKKLIENEINVKEQNEQSSKEFTHHKKIKQKKETVEDYIHNLLFELNQWNETWEKCIIMATKVIKYHTISAQNTDQQRAILIDIVQKLCGTIIAETKCIDTDNDLSYHNKYHELTEKRKKDKIRLKKMQKRCEKLYVEVQKNREMIESISQNAKDKLNEENFLEALVNKHQKDIIDHRKKQEKNLNLHEQQIENDKKFKKEMTNLHKKRKDRMRSNRTDKSNDNSNNSKDVHSLNEYYDTNNSFPYDDNNDYSYNNYSSDSEPDSMLYSKITKNTTDSTDINKDEITQDDYSNNLKRIIKIVSNLEKNCNQTQTNIDDQIFLSSKTKSRKEASNSFSHSSKHSKNQTQLNENELSLESLEKMHISLAEVEKSFSTS